MKIGIYFAKKGGYNSAMTLRRKSYVSVEFLYDQ